MIAMYYSCCCDGFVVGKRGHASSKDLPQTVEWTKFVLYCTEKCRKFKLSSQVGHSFLFSKLGIRAKV